MIGMLQGVVVDREDNQICLLANGVGHEVHCTLNTLSSLSSDLSKEDKEVRLWTHLIVREDVLQLYGFVDKKERSLFRELIRISGIGPKVALGVLSGMDSNGLIRAIHSGDSAMLTKLPGIGKKTAERLVVEMRDRLEGWEVSAAGGTELSSEPNSSAKDNRAEAEQALVALGYRAVEASKMLSAIDMGSEDELGVEELIRQALQSRLKS